MSTTCPTSQTNCTSNPSWCPAGGTLECTNDTGCTPSQTVSCVTWVNSTASPTETVNCVGNSGGQSACFSIEPGCSWTIEIALPAVWTITGATTTTILVQDFTTNASGSYNVSSTPPIIGYSKHKVIPWLPMAIGTGLGAAAVAGYGIFVNDNARRRVCTANPAICTFKVDPKLSTNKGKPTGYPQGFKRNLWVLPAIILGLLAIALALGYAASLGAFGYSTLPYDQCLARSNGWVFSSLDNTSFSNFVVRWFGLGRCANRYSEANCSVIASTTGEPYRYDTHVAQDPREAYYLCACLDTRNNNQGWNCSSASGSLPCTICASGIPGYQ